MDGGKIVFNTKLDNKALEKDLAKAEKKINDLEKNLASMRQKKMPLVEQSKQLAASLDEAKAKLYEMQNASKGTFLKTDISEQKEHVRALQTEFNKVQGAVENYDRRIADANVELDQAKEKAGALHKELAKAGSATNRMKNATAAAEKKMDKFVLRVKNLAKRVLVFTVITMALRSLRDWLWSVIKTNDEAVSAVARLKGALLTIAQPLVNIVIPAFTMLVALITVLITKIAQLLSSLFGVTMAASAEAAEALYNEQKALEGVGSAAKKTSKQLASFDEINKLGSSEDSGSSSGEIAPDFSSVTNTNWVEEALGDVAGKVAAAILLGGIALVAIGAATASLSAVLAGLVFLGVGIVLSEESKEVQSWAEKLGLDSVNQFISTALLLGGIAIIAIGAMMGNILMVLAGLGLIGASVAYANEETRATWAETLGLDSIVDYVGVAMQLAGIAMIAIGACKGNIFLIVAGCALLAAGVMVDVLGEETLSKWWDVLQLTSVAQWVGVATLLAGIALVAIGACLGNILMILAGMGLLALSTLTFSSEEVSLRDWVKTLGLEKVAGWVTAGLLLVGLALVVFGIFSGNIAMVLAGAGLLGAGISVGITSGTFSNWLNTILTALTGFKKKFLDVWNELLNGWKVIINGIAGGVEWLANKIIDGINAAIKALNGLSFTVPDWLGGGTFGFNIKPLQNVSIPRLAAGAVIPPNREFLAVLGDQTSGNNIEAPESLIRKIVREEAGGFNAELLEAILEAIKAGHVIKIGEKSFAQIAIKAINNETRAAGKSLLLV